MPSFTEHTWGPYLSERQWGTVREGLLRPWHRLGFLPPRPRPIPRLSLGRRRHRRPELRSTTALRLSGAVEHARPDPQRTPVRINQLRGQPWRGRQRALLLPGRHPGPLLSQDALQVSAGRVSLCRSGAENGRRGKQEPEYELLDTGVLAEDRYFDVFVEYAKPAPTDIHGRITICNRGPEAATVHVLPQLFFRNTWSWKQGGHKPLLAAGGSRQVTAKHPAHGDYFFYADDDAQWLFCENETNTGRLYGAAGGPAYPKDAFHRYVVDGDASAVDPQARGTKCAAHSVRHIPAGGQTVVRFRLTTAAVTNPLADSDAVFAAAIAGADSFYHRLQKDLACPDARLVQRQALAGMIWSKQFFYYDVPEWLAGDPAQPAPPGERHSGRNSEWTHLNNADILSMPDKWEYPWYAAWDLAFHCIPLALVDAAFAKQQLLLLTREWYMHPNGQLPAYEWAFGDVNPPVHAWATWRVFQIDRKQRGGTGDLAFLERVFHKLMLNFTWWVNRKDAEGRNVFQGGFLGLDNIGVFDRSAPLPTGGHIDQADGTSWMAMYALNLMRMALELARQNPVYEDIATKFFEHFLQIAEAMAHRGLWDDEDEFFYDALHVHEQAIPLKVRSMVGLIPLFAVETLEPDLLDALPGFQERLDWFLTNRPALASLVSRWSEPGRGERRLLSLLRGHRLKCLLRRMLDESEFLSPYGVRAISRHHAAYPYRFSVNGDQLEVSYQPAESNSGLFGGNSNWRGPIWMPVNYLLIESLERFHHYYGPEFRVECPTGSGRFLSLDEVARELRTRLGQIFLRNGSGERAVNGLYPHLNHDPHFRDYVLFHEYFDGDSGRGVGASHQTGWTGLIAKLLHPRRVE